MNKTLKALLELGIDNIKAEMICSQKLSLNDLKLKENLALTQLGFTEDEIIAIHSTPRPPIPEDNLKNIFYKSRFSCAVCRDKNKGVIVHHIEPWEKSHSHEESNLILLCMDCHDKAHSYHEISKNLSPKILRGLKKEWENKTWVNDTEIIIKSISENSPLGFGVCWDWFNVKRLFEVLEMLNVNKKILNNYIPDDLMNSWLKIDEKKKYWVEGIYDFNESEYLKEIINTLVRSVKFNLLNTLWSIEGIATLKSGDFIVFQKDFYFKEIDKNSKTRLCYSKRDNIRIEYIIDPWYCMSSSSYYLHLTGHQKSTTFGIIRDIESNENETVIKASLLAMGISFADIKKYLLYL